MANDLSGIYNYLNNRPQLGMGGENNNVQNLPPGVTQQTVGGNEGNSGTTQYSFTPPEQNLNGIVSLGQQGGTDNTGSSWNVDYSRLPNNGMTQYGRVDATAPFVAGGQYLNPSLHSNSAYGQITPFSNIKQHDNSFMDKFTSIIPQVAMTAFTAGVGMPSWATAGAKAAKTFGNSQGGGVNTMPLYNNGSLVSGDIGGPVTYANGSSGGQIGGAPYVRPQPGPVGMAAPASSEMNLGTTPDYWGTQQSDFSPGLGGGSGMSAGGYDPNYNGQDVGGMGSIGQGSSGEFLGGSQTNPSDFMGEIGNNAGGFLSTMGNSFLPQIGNAVSNGLGNIANGASAIAIPTALKQWNDAGKYMDVANQAANRADPFGNRQQYIDKLSQSYSDPNAFLNNPENTAIKENALNQIQSRNRAGGYMGGGRDSQDMANYITQQNNQYLSQQRKDLLPYTGAQFDPANAGNMLMKGQQNAINSQNMALGTLGSIAGSQLGAQNIGQRPTLANPNPQQQGSSGGVNPSQAVNQARQQASGSGLGGVPNVGAGGSFAPNLSSQYWNQYTPGNYNPTDIANQEQAVTAGNTGLGNTGFDEFGNPIDQWGNPLDTNYTDWGPPVDWGLEDLSGGFPF